MCCLRRSENGCLLMQVAGWDQCMSYMHHLQNMSCSLEPLWTPKDIQVLQFVHLPPSGTVREPNSGIRENFACVIQNPG